MVSNIFLLIIWFDLFFIKRGVAYYRIIFLWRSKLFNVMMNDGYSFGKWWSRDIFFRLGIYTSINLYSINVWEWIFLRIHQAQHASSCADVKNTFHFSLFTFIFVSNPCAKQTCVGSNLHHATILVDYELFEFKVRIRHAWVWSSKFDVVIITCKLLKNRTSNLPTGSCIRSNWKISKIFFNKLIISSDGDHGSIVSAVLKGGDKCVPMIFFSCLLECCSQPAIGRNSASNADIFYPGLYGGLFQFVQ